MRKAAEEEMAASPPHNVTAFSSAQHPHALLRPHVRRRRKNGFTCRYSIIAVGGL